jgi:hypothetical protein
VTSTELENLVALGTLKREPCSPREFEGLVRSGEARLSDASNAALAIESRFDLAYNAAHALALAALRARGYRSESRYVVFQVLPHTLGLPAPTWRVLAKCHERRNLAEYEGVVDVDERLMADLLAAARAVLAAVRALPASERPRA